MEPDPGQAAAHCRRQIEGERATPVDQGLVEERRHDVPRVAQGGSNPPDAALRTHRHLSRAGGKRLGPGKGGSFRLTRGAAFQIAA